MRLAASCFAGERCGGEGGRVGVFVYALMRLDRRDDDNGKQRDQQDKHYALLYVFVPWLEGWMD